MRNFSTSPGLAKLQMLLRSLLIVFFLVIAAYAQGPFNILNQPSLTNRPYPKAYYNQKLPNAGSGGPMTHLMPNSDSMISTIFAYTPVTSFDGYYAATPGQQDQGLGALYYGQSTDPVYTVTGCTGPSTSTAVNGQSFHAPSAAPYSQGETDEEIQIWDQPSNKIFAFYWGSGGAHTLPACAGSCSFNPGNGYCSVMNYSTGSGIDAGTGGSSAGNGPLGNMIRMGEIVTAGHINHGIRVYETCNGTGNGLYPGFAVFPANQTSGAVALKCDQMSLPDTNRPPNGSLVFLDYTQAQLDCFNPAKSSCTGVAKMAPLQYMITEAMTLYGGTIEGTTGSFSTSNIGVFKTESEQPYVFYDTHGYSGAAAVATKFTNWMNANCTSPSCVTATRSTTPPYSAYTWNSHQWAGISSVAGPNCPSSTCGVASHMHIADPCVTVGLQGLANDGKGTNACVTTTAGTPAAPTALAVIVN